MPDQAVLITAIGALAGLLILVFRLFLNGTLLSRTTVPREDYDRQVAIVADYAVKFGEQTKAVQSLTGIIEKQNDMIAASRNSTSRSRVRSNRPG